MMDYFFKTRWLLPISSPPIQDAVIGIRHHSISSIASASEFSQSSTPIVDLGETVLLPAFVNAHSHLELGALQGFKRRGGFTQWICDLLAAKESLSQDAEKRGLHRAADSLWQSGVHTVADHVSRDGPIGEIITTPLRGRLFMELLGKEIQLPVDFPKNPFWTLHPSPHSVHALAPSRFSTILSDYPQEKPLFSIHLYESNDEQRYFSPHDGPLTELIQSRGMGAVRKDPLEELAVSGLLSFPMLIVHGNTITDRELAQLDPTRHYFVHCPGSHCYFEHPRFPLEMIEMHGFRIALGTDSAASSVSQDFLEELRRFRKAYPHKKPSEILRMATLIGAEALQFADVLGSIQIGKDAELIGFPYSGGDPHESIFNAQTVSWHYSRQAAQMPKSSRR